MSNKWSRGVVAVLSVTFLSSLGHTAVLRVPGDYAAIQKAIDNSKNGDVILVSPGVYNENINFKGKAITVASTNAADPEVVKSTIIHAAAKIFQQGPPILREPFVALTCPNSLY